jgi:2-polyprenyl-3-methyl-5-hydroxy-6-metoxy-1,4-benzoquinol methylase
MSEFDLKAAGWDQNPMHWDRSLAIANEIKKIISLNKEMTALEYGAGTGIASFLLKDHLKEITMMDNSAEMVRIMNEKIISSGAGNLKTLFFDLEKDQWNGNRFDLIVTQMVLHHVADIGSIITKFNNLLNPGGFLAIADLYPEDGTFHGEGFTGHKGFNTDELAVLIRNKGFTNVTCRKCFVINKKINDSETRQFDVFLMISKSRNT